VCPGRVLSVPSPSPNGQPYPPPPHKSLVGFARVRHLTDSGTVAPFPLPPNHREPHTSLSSPKTASLRNGAPAGGIVTAPRTTPVIQGSKGCDHGVFYACQPHHQPCLHQIVRSAFSPWPARLLPLRSAPSNCRPCGLALPTLLRRPIDRDSSLPILLGTAQRSAAMARFLETTRACMAPSQTWNTE
jgi:hypothetical protein